jgi:hypothetical protein
MKKPFHLIIFLWYFIASSTCILNEEYSYAIKGLNGIEDDLVFSLDDKYGRLTGDVQNWAAIIQNYIIQV